MELNNTLVEKCNLLGYKISDCKDLKELCDLLPKYIFIDKSLWCGNIHVDADDYDYPNAVLKMLIKLNK